MVSTELAAAQVGFAYEEVKRRLLPGGRHNQLFAPQYYSALPESSKVRVFPDLRVVVESSEDGVTVREQHVLRSYTYPMILSDVTSAILDNMSVDTVRFEYNKSDFAVIREAIRTGTLQFRTIFVGDSYDEAPTPPLILSRGETGGTSGFSYAITSEAGNAIDCQVDPGTCWAGRFASYQAFVKGGPKTSQRTIYRRNDGPIWTVGYWAGGAYANAMICSPAPRRGYRVRTGGQSVKSLLSAWGAHVAPRKVAGALVELPRSFATIPACRLPDFCNSAGESCRNVVANPIACVVDADLSAWQVRRRISSANRCL